LATKRLRKLKKKKLPRILTTDYADRTDEETGILVAKISFAWQIDCLQSPFHAFPDLAVASSGLGMGRRMRAEIPIQDRDASP